jgi:hypothetical protein
MHFNIPCACLYIYTPQILLLDLLDNLPRNRLSDSVLKMILWILEELHVRDVPSFHAFRQAQNTLRKEAGVATHEYRSARGNIFYMNDIGTLIAKVCCVVYNTTPVLS